MTSPKESEVPELGSNFLLATLVVTTVTVIFIIACEGFFLASVTTGPTTRALHVIRGVAARRHDLEVVRNALVALGSYLTILMWLSGAIHPEVLEIERQDHDHFRQGALESGSDGERLRSSNFLGDR